MPKATVREERRVEVACPNCGEGWHRVDHLFADRRPFGPTRFGPWSCDECGFYFCGSVNSPEDIEVEITKPDECSVPCYDLLVLPPQKEPVFFLLDRKDYGRKIGEEPFSGKEYLYEEHTCPVNWTSDIVQIIIGDDNDPHGLFRYVGSMDRGPKQKTEPGVPFIPQEENAARVLIGRYAGDDADAASATEAEGGDA